jgi:starch synthase
MATRSKLKVLFASSEVEPYSKTGGLADVAGSLPVALNKSGVDIRVVTPKYKCVKVKGNETLLGGKVPVYFVENDGYFMRDGLYAENGNDYGDNLDRFVFFSKQVLEIIRKKKFKPDIIHCNDWQTALVPLYLKEIFWPKYKSCRGIRTLLTVHNLGYQGVFSKLDFPKTQLGWEYFTMHRLEFYDMVNVLKGGLVFSDFISTVSPAYAEEIQTGEFGYGLDPLLRERRDHLFGILNGIDYGEWNPSKDTELKYHFSASRPGGKAMDKALLQKECGLDVRADMPVIGVISRLADQKGLDLISGMINRLLDDMDVQFVLLGTGEEKYHRLFGEIGSRMPRKASINLKFDEVLAKKIYAGSDMFLMPSRYEPCGLGQMISLRYGTIPIARNTGGLADTISEFNIKTGEGNGFLFGRYDTWELFDAVRRALMVYKQKRLWTKLVSNAMACDFSWQRSAKKYLELYKKLV